MTQHKSKQKKLVKRGFPKKGDNTFSTRTWIVDLHFVIHYERNKELKIAIKEAIENEAQELGLIHGWGKNNPRNEGGARRAFHNLLISTQYNWEHIRVPQLSNGGVTLISTSGRPYELANIAKGSALFVNDKRDCLEINGFHPEIERMRPRAIAAEITNRIRKWKTGEVHISSNSQQKLNDTFDSLVMRIRQPIEIYFKPGFGAHLVIKSQG